MFDYWEGVSNAVFDFWKMEKKVFEKEFLLLGPLFSSSRPFYRRMVSKFIKLALNYFIFQLQSPANLIKCSLEHSTCTYSL